MRYALIPVKELPRAKARLANVLDDEQRRALVLAMYRDVLETALACRALDAVAVVSRDEEALAFARELGAEARPEPGGLNEALDSAARALADRGVDRLVVLAADLPLATPEAIAAVAETAADVAIVPSRDGGTNALALPAPAFGFRFGPESARRHEEAARASGLQVERLDLPTLTLDIDTPEDLERLQGEVGAGRRAGPHTNALLEMLAEAQHKQPDPSRSSSLSRAKGSG